MPYKGEFAALLTALLWTATAISFEIASRRVGSLAVNVIRLSFAFVYLFVFTWIYRGQPLPLDASLHAWIWLLLSGLVGFVFGDYFLFRAFGIMGSRTTMLIQTLVPPITAFTGLFLLGERMIPRHLLGMALTMGGIALVVLNRSNSNGKLGLSFPVKGLLFALAGALGQAMGLVLSKVGMGSYDPFASTQIRIIAGMTGFIGLTLALGKWGVVRNALPNRVAMRGIVAGSVFGPFLGVSFSLLAIQNTQAGIASTLMALTPVLIIAPSAMVFRQKVTWKEVAGAVVSVSGAALFFL